MYYVIHTNVFSEPHWDMLMNWIERYKIDHEVIPFKQYVTEVELKTKRKDIWCWGSVSLAKLAKKYEWEPGSMLNDNHDFEVYSMWYGKNMLNWDGEITNLGSPLPEWAEYFFARPTKDSKAFTGQVFWDYSWKEWVEQKLTEETVTGKNLLTPNTRVLIAPVRNIEQEVRCWVVGGKVITASRYKLGNRVSYQNYDNESFFVDFAQSMVDLYQPAEAFVIDVCLSQGELKVVEINCINCAGFYHADMNKLMEAVENHFSFNAF